MKAKWDIDMGQFNGCLSSITWKVFTPRGSSHTTSFFGLKPWRFELKYVLRGSIERCHDRSFFYILDQKPEVIIPNFKYYYCCFPLNISMMSDSETFELDCNGFILYVWKYIFFSIQFLTFHFTKFFSFP